MKAAMWGVGLFVLGLLGLVLINLFGNITVTNQFNYTTMKNAVQASMLDSLDIAHYRAGFCLCTKDGSAMNSGTLKSFSDKNQYEFRDIVDDKCIDVNNEIMSNCVTLYGEYRLNMEKFEKSFGERFANVKTNNKEYEYIIKEIIEYPPKVSVMVISKDDEFFATDKEAGGYNIVNQIDAIVETNGKITVNYQPTPTVEEYTITVHHYLEGTTTKVHADTKVTEKRGEKYTTKYLATTELDNAYKNEYSWNGTTPKNASGVVEDSDIAVIYYYKANPVKQYTITVHHYLEGTTTKVHADTTMTKNKGDQYTTKYFATSELDSKYKNDYVWNGTTPKNASGTVGDSNITVTYYYKLNPNKQYTITVHHYLTGTTTKVHADTTIKKKKGEKYSTSYYTPGALEGKYKSKYIWNGTTPKNASGTMGTSNITVTYYYKAKASSSVSNCKWHFKLTCNGKIDVDAGHIISNLSMVHTSPRGSSQNSTAAKNSCESEWNSSYKNSFASHTCLAVRDYRCTINGTTRTYYSRTSAPGDNCVCLG